jgi:hypothetical protein
MSEIINTIEDQNQDKLVRVSFIKGILNKLYNWLPFRQNTDGSIVQTEADGTTTNEVNNPNEVALGKYNLSDFDTVFSIGIGDKNQRKNAISINRNGEIFVITDLAVSNVESLQKQLEASKVIFTNTYDEILLYLSTNKHLGRFLYLLEDDTYNGTVYEVGLYVIAKDKHGKPAIMKIGSSIEKKLLNYYTKEEVNILFDKITSGDIDLANYYNIQQIDIKFEELNKRVKIIEDWKEEPIEDDILLEIFK